MNFDWQMYLILAKCLYNNCNEISHEEACLRAAISRGYYAAFCTARNLARDRNQIDLSGRSSDHRDVKNFYKSARQAGNDPLLRENLQKVGNKLDRLRDYRNKADYIDHLPGLRSDTQVAIQLASDILDLLQNIYPHP